MSAVIEFFLIPNKIIHTFELEHQFGHIVRPLIIHRLKETGNIVVPQEIVNRPYFVQFSIALFDCVRYPLPKKSGIRSVGHEMRSECCVPQNLSGYNKQINTYSSPLYK